MRSSITKAGKRVFKLLLIFYLTLVSILAAALLTAHLQNTLKTTVLAYSQNTYSETARELPDPTQTPTPTRSPTTTPTPYPTQTITEEEQVPEKNTKEEPQEWGVAKQLDEYTWTIKVSDDETMAGAQDIYSALNEYRNRHGSSTLAWDQGLAEFAQERANHFNSIGGTDSHAGFNNFLENEDGFTKLGFNAIGENSSWGYTLNGVHIIEWVYASDPPHNNNQLDQEWTHVGIGVAGTSTDLIFAGRKR